MQIRVQSPFVYNDLFFRGPYSMCVVAATCVTGHLWCKRKQEGWAVFRRASHTDYDPGWGPEVTFSWKFSRFFADRPDAVAFMNDAQDEDGARECGKSTSASCT